MKTIYTYELPQDAHHGHLCLRLSVLECKMLSHDTKLLVFESQCPAVWLHGLLELRHKCKEAELCLFQLIQSLTKALGQSLTQNTRVHVYVDEKSQLVETNGQVTLTTGSNSLLAFPLNENLDSQAGFDKICSVVLEQTELSAPLLTALQLMHINAPELDKDPGDPSTWWHAKHPLASCTQPWPANHDVRLVHAPEPSHRVEIFYKGKHVGHLEPSSREEFTVNVPSRSRKAIIANVYSPTTLRECFDDLFSRTEIL